MKNLEDLKLNVKIKISALWMALMLLYIYADILTLFRPGIVEEMIAGKMGPFPVTQQALFLATIMMAIPALMVFLSLTLKASVNRWANIILGILYTAVSVGNLIGETWLYYLFFGILEIIMALFIIRFAFSWPEEVTT